MYFNITKPYIWTIAPSAIKGPVSNLSSALHCMKVLRRRYYPFILFSWPGRQLIGSKCHLTSDLLHLHWLSLGNTEQSEQSRLARTGPLWCFDLNSFPARFLQSFVIFCIILVPLLTYTYHWPLIEGSALRHLYLSLFLHSYVLVMDYLTLSSDASDKIDCKVNKCKSTINI